MSKYKKWSLVGLRISLGLYFLHAGITKLIDPAWSAAGYISNASTFPELYAYLASPTILPIINFLNVWGLTLLGVSLILGVLVRLSAPLGALLMLLYYFPALSAPYISTENFFVDSHILYAFALLVVAAFDAGKVFGLSKPLKRFIHRRSS